MDKRLTRADVPAEQTWDLSALYPSAAAWKADLSTIEADVQSVTVYKGRLGEGASVLRACLDAQESLLERHFRAATYANLRISEDGSNPENQADYDLVLSLDARLQAALAFIKPEILALPAGTVERYMQEEPGLSALRYHLERILELRPHTLSLQTEEALAAFGEVHGAPFVIYERARSSDMQYPPVRTPDGRELPMSLALYEDAYEDSADVQVRRGGFASLAEGLSGFQNTLAATFATEVKKNVVEARLRGYPSATHMLLKPHQVSLEAYHNVLDIIQAELAPHMRRLVNLRRRVLGLDTIMYCDVEAPMDPGYNPQISYEEASDLMVEALSVLGPEYTEIMQTAVRDRWVDRCDNIGKQTGAFCSSPYGSHSFILMTWTGSMRNAFTLAHELGHAGHFELSNRNQRLFNVEPSMYFVEAPSTLNELIVGNHILARSKSERMRRWVMLQFLQTFHHNFVRHLLEGELQRRVYALAEEGTPITAETLCTLKGDVLEQFWGESVVIDQGARLTWMRQPHYYLGLYPYTYSAGLVCSTAVAQLMREQGGTVAERWIQVLKAGGSRPPLELAKMAGVDMSTPEPIRVAVAHVGAIVDDLERSFAKPAD